MTDTASIDGSRDIACATADLAGRLPEPLAPLARLAFNYRWSWLPGAPELFEALDPERFALCGQNPVRMLGELPRRRLEAIAADASLLERAGQLESELRAELKRPVEERWRAVDAPIAFLCAEYGVHVSLPVYSGGLGALAGDLLKEASDRGLDLVAVGLMYRKGYFRQRIDASGWQHEYWVETDPERLPAALVTAEDGAPLTVAVPIGAGIVTARIWRVDVGRVALYMLDSDCPENDPLQRWITGRLYDGDPQTRLAQYALLGVGGVRALRAMGYEPGVIHLNEGHAALAPLELGRSGDGTTAPLEELVERARARTVFTTHTPVPAGNDSYAPAEIEEALGSLAVELGATPAELLALGRNAPRDGNGPDEGAPFGVTQAALRLSRGAGAVSRRHGEVAREMWRDPMWPDRPLEEVPIGHVTNGVHVPTWLGAPMRALLDAHLPEDWRERQDDPDVWAAVEKISDGDLWGARGQQRTELVEFIRARSVADRLGRGDLRGYVDAAARTFDSAALTIGFARRVATYKRLDLLTRDPEWTLALLDGPHPVQVVLAGKAHPRDEEAKRALQSLFGLKAARVIGERVVFLDDYDLATGARLVRGCDVWLNVPRPPLEASGTSGMKSVFNGGLQLSVLDGWWAEAYSPGGEAGSAPAPGGAVPNGWAIPGEVDTDHQAQDARHADALHQLLEHEVVPAFYDRDESGLPVRWLRMIRASLRTLGPRFSATRMLGEYVDGPYRG
ncbi:MAG TPA: alpha-glucan family phosphorylase [Solirubrobacteraceae bacterium]|nr:alpha-glucan family phosphorylase [Solirubrobacteraceae bacterium]